jgi:hypothetical protein
MCSTNRSDIHGKWHFFSQQLLSYPTIVYCHFFVNAAQINICFNNPEFLRGKENLGLNKNMRNERGRGLSRRRAILIKKIIQNSKNLNC